MLVTPARAFAHRPLDPQVETCLEDVPDRYLEFTEEAGFDFVVQERDQGLDDVGVLRTLDLEQYRAQLPEMRKLAEAGYTPKDLQRDRPITSLAERQPYDLVTFAEGDSLEEVARNQGAESPEQVALYSELFTAINGAGPYDFDKVLAPNIGFHGDTILDGDDFWAQDAWSENGVRGQVFPLGGINKVVLREDSVDEHTSVHELGHAIDIALQRENPELYEQLVPQMEKLLYRARLGELEVSDYAKANRLEFFAESFRVFIQNPKELPQEVRRLMETVHSAISHRPEIRQRFEQQIQALSQQLPQTKQQTTAQLLETSKQLVGASLPPLIAGLTAGAIDAALDLRGEDRPAVDSAAHFAQQHQPQKLPELMQRAARNISEIAPEEQFEFGYQVGAVEAFLLLETSHPIFPREVLGSQSLIGSY